MRPPVKAVPDGFSTVTAHITVKGAAKAIEFYNKAFGADELMRIPGPGGSIMHAAIAVGDSVIMLNDESPEMGAVGPQTLGGSPVVLHLYVDDADAWFDRAVKAGAAARMPMTDMFWGDRYGAVTDPFGHVWSIATHTEDLSPEQIAERQQAFFAQCAQ